ncbi:MAG: DNA primase DnaG [Haloquadratum sp.]
MEDTEKYLIHAAITADGVVERSDVVGAIFGQTEGLLGDDLDLRDLQQSSKVGRIDVEIDSQNGQSFGTVTIASSLDRVKTAILAASLETITRVGPCRATVEVTDIEDVREAKRREVVERAKELLSESFDESVMSSTEILEEVKESVRIEDITEYEGLPAGPNVADSDAVIVVEGRADVLTLLGYGIKNAIAVEGTDVPDAVADLTQERTTTAFFDGDRGGELILRELAQVGDVDYVAFAPEGKSVEDLQRHEAFSALRDKVPIESFSTDGDIEELDVAEGEETPSDPRQGSPTTESAAPNRCRSAGADDDAEAAHPDDHLTGVERPAEAVDADADAAATDESAVEVGAGSDAGATADTGVEGAPTDSESESKPESTPLEEGDEPAIEEGDGSTSDGPRGGAADDSTRGPRSLQDHVREVIDDESGIVRFLDEDFAILEDHPAADAFDALADADPVPYAAVVDGEIDQRLLDVAAQRGVDHAVGTSTGEFVKKPVGVRLLTAEQLMNSVAN